MTDDRSQKPFDAGLQPERTALAWRRTGLALAVGAVIAIRILPERLGSWALAPAGAGLILSIIIMVSSHMRYLDAHRRLTKASDDRIPLPDGRLPLLLTITVIGGGLACLLVVLSFPMP